MVLLRNLQRWPILLDHQYYVIVVTVEDPTANTQTAAEGLCRSADTATQKQMDCRMCYLFRFLNLISKVFTFLASCHVEYTKTIKESTF